LGGADGTAQATSTASVVLSPQSKLIVLRSLSSFLSQAIDPQSFASGSSNSELGLAAIPLPTWFLRPSFTCARLYEENSGIFQTSRFGNHGKHVVWTPEPEFESLDEDFVYDPKTIAGPSDAAWTLNDLSDFSLEQDDASRGLGDIPFVVLLSRTLYATLTAAYLDCAPVVFSPSTNPPETDLQMLTAALKITRTLYSSILQKTGHGSDLSTSCEELKTLLGYLTGYFPFNPAHREVKVEQAFQDLNVIYCELTSLLVLVSSQSSIGNIRRGNPRLRPQRQKAPSASLRGDAKLIVQAGLVSSYVIRLLRGEGELGVQLPRPVSPMVYTALLPTIWALLNQVAGPGDGPSSVLSATLDHALRTTTNSAAKRLTVEFVARLLLLEKESGYVGHFNPRDAGEHNKFQEWVLHLPKVLWELGTNNLATTQVCSTTPTSSAFTPPSQQPTL
jgi:pre-rRNA-processing protein IPI1